jgi:dTMP kinase
LLLDAPVEAGLARAQGRRAGVGTDRFESERRDFFERVRKAYLERARREPDRFRIIDASGDVDTVAAAVRAALQPLTVERT